MSVFLDYSKKITLQTLQCDTYIVGLNGPFRGRIIGGTPAKISEAPYQVELIFQGVLLCGGSIVASKHVVSAAHCLHK